MWMMKTRQNKC